MPATTLAMRVLALDLGRARIGVAVSDPTGTLASPVGFVPRDGGAHRAIGRLVAEWEAERIVVGLPRSMDGKERDAARAARSEAAEIGRAVGVPVELHDERLTTVAAHAGLGATGHRAKDRRTMVDAAAAAVLLQSWLDTRARARADDDPTVPSAPEETT